MPFSEQVFEAVEKGRADYGFVPVENSIAGGVGVNCDLLLARPVFAVAESYLHIEHCLLGSPGTALADVEVVYSHPVALAQCREFLNGRHIRAVPEYDTAGAAELVAGRMDKKEAAIASKACAEAYGLKVLADDIQAVKGNFTRFLAFQREKEAPKGLKMEKTSLAFAVKHHPGALLNCLKRFADHKINLTKLESRPIPENPFEYVFFVDFLGGLDDAQVKEALAQLQFDARQVKVLGSYPLGRR